MARLVAAVRREGPWDYDVACQHLAKHGLRDAIANYAKLPETVSRFLPSGDGESAAPFVCDKQSIFTALSSAIIYQQLAGTAAVKIYGRFKGLFDGQSPTPEQVRDRGAVIKSAGLSQRKTEYVLGLSEAMLDGTVEAERIPDMSDEEVADTLCSIRGLGPWTVEMMLLFTLKRPDVLPCGDHGIVRGVMHLNGLRSPPKKEKMEALTEAWRPYRSLGSYLMYRVAEEGKAAKKGKGEIKEADLKNRVPGVQPLTSTLTPPVKKSADAATSESPAKKRRKSSRTQTSSKPEETEDDAATPPPKRRRLSRVKASA